MANHRAGDPFVCIRCTIGDHPNCLGPVCECLHVHEAWISPGRRKELRENAVPRNEHETDYVLSYTTHREDRRAADDRRD